jgi:hypothetical protein
MGQQNCWTFPGFMLQRSRLEMAPLEEGKLPSHFPQAPQTSWAWSRVSQRFVDKLHGCICLCPFSYPEVARSCSKVRSWHKLSFHLPILSSLKCLMCYLVKHKWLQFSAPSDSRKHVKETGIQARGEGDIRSWRASWNEKMLEIRRQQKLRLQNPGNNSLKKKGR